MNFGSMLDDSFAYAQESIRGKYTRWLILILCMVIFPLILGYIVRIYRGERPAPEPGQWSTLFTDGLKLLVVHIIYLAPVILLLIIAFIPLISTLSASGVFSPGFSSMSDSQSRQWLDKHPEFLSDLLLAGGFMIFILVLDVIVAIVLSLFSFLGVVRFSRSRNISEAFNFSALLAHIRRIGWINYFIALITITAIGVIFTMILNIFSLIPVIGTIFGFIVTVVLYIPFLIFSARFSALVYDIGEEKPDGGQGVLLPAD